MASRGARGEGPLCAHRFLWSQCAQLGTLQCTDLTASGAGGCSSGGRRRWWVSERSRGAGLQALVGVRALTWHWTPEGGPRELEAISGSYLWFFVFFECRSPRAPARSFGDAAREPCRVPALSVVDEAPGCDGRRRKLTTRFRAPSTLASGPSALPSRQH